MKEGSVRGPIFSLDKAGRRLNPLLYPVSSPTLKFPVSRISVIITGVVKLVSRVLNRCKIGRQ